MMKFTLTTLVLVFTLMSCANDQNIDDVTETSQSNLKTYTLSKDDNGAYIINYEVSKNTAVETMADYEENQNEFYLSTSGNIASEKGIEKELIFNDNYLKVVFYEDATISRGLIIEDDIDGENNDTYLESYSITDLGDDSYEVNFRVKEGVAVAFEYNEADNIYEIQLEPGTSKTQDFSKIFVKKYDGMRIDFVNYSLSQSAKVISAGRKPRVIPMG